MPDTAIRKPADSSDVRRSSYRLPLFLIIVGIAFAVRLIYLWDVRGCPLYSFPVGDGRSYWQWADKLVAGDWVGSGVFYQAPLYPYFLGLVRSLGLHGYVGIYVVQSFLGALACGFVFLAGSMFFSDKVGQIAGVILAFYAPAVFYDGVLQKATLDFFFVSALLALLAWSLQKPAHWKWLLIGCTLGLLSLTRENALVLIPVVAAWLAVYFRKEQRRRRLGWAGALAAGLIIVLMPVMIRNRVVGGDFAITTSQMGANFFMGNSEHSTGSYIALREGRGDPQFEKQDATEMAEEANHGRKLSSSEVSRYWMGQAFNYIGAHPARWVGLMFRKTAIFWQSYEPPDEEDLYLYKLYSPWLRALGYTFQFGVLCPLALMGIVVTWRKRRRLWVLYAITFAFAASVIAFYIFARYRLAVVPIMALFAAACLVEIFSAIENRRRKFLVATLSGLVVLGVLINLPSPLGNPSKPDRYVLARTLTELGDAQGAEENYRIQLDQTPKAPHAHYNLGNVLRRKAEKLGPNLPEAQAMLDEAVEHYKKAAEQLTGWAPPIGNMGYIYGMKGQYDKAEECFRRALEIDPADANARNNLEFCLELAGKGGNISAPKLQEPASEKGAQTHGAKTQ